ncbi:sensor histidine kinase [Paenibacillaceae bacterium WGS1546]|uniref:sensor histidine kinase n=1 Tax=Cohnella sp. WGS1546 TaxID=3366810 RepID=UPI00372D533A
MSAKWVTRWRDRLVRPRIRTRLLVSYLAVILFTVSMVGFLSYRISTNEMVRHSKAYSSMLTNQMSQTVPGKAKNFEQSTYAIQNNEKLYELLKESVEFATQEEIYRNRRNVESILSLFFGLSRDIRIVLVESPEGHLYWYEKNSFASISGGISGREARELYDWADRRLEALGAGRPQSLWLPGAKRGEIVYTRRLIDPNTLQSRGRIVFYLSDAYLKASIDDEYSAYGGSTAILNRYGDVLAAEPDMLPVLEAWSARPDGRSRSRTVIEAAGKKYDVTSRMSVDAGWETLHLVPQSELYRPSRQLGTYLLGTSVVSLLLTVFIAAWTSNLVSGNIRKLERTMRRVEEGDFSVQVQTAGRDEIGLLGQRFNLMLSRINELIQNLYIERLAKQQAEFQVLRAQIHPHFLYNTLGSIQWLARSAGQKVIERMVANLIGLLKMSVKRKSEFVTVREEFEYIEHYLSIQAFRFEDRFKVAYEKDEALMDRMMLHFILQPLVENALLHGIEMSKGVGLLTIRAFAANGSFFLEVEDNGVGMTPEQQRKILSEDGEGAYPGLHSIGVRNVNERIKLYYGDEYGLRYRSEPGVGTVATVRLPLGRPMGGMNDAKRHDRGR